jgi:hypothetical protein
MLTNQGAQKSLMGKATTCLLLISILGYLFYCFLYYLASFIGPFNFPENWSSFFGVGFYFFIVF